MNTTIRTVTALISLNLTLVALAAPAAPRTISGTVTATGGHSLKGTVVIACPKGDCDSDDVRGVVISSTKSKADFTIKDLGTVPYAIYAVQDNDGDEDVSPGDWVDRALLADQPTTPVKIGTTNVKLELVEVKKPASASTPPAKTTSSAPAKPSTPPAPAKPSTSATAQRGYITGRVVNEQGVPLPGVEVVADNTAAYDSNLITHTDAQGNYRIDVRTAPVTFNVTATLPLR